MRKKMMMMMNAVEGTSRSRRQRPKPPSAGGRTSSIFTGCLLSLLFAGLPSAAEPATAARSETAHRDWSVIRVGEEGCLATQQVHGQRTGAVLVEAVFSPAAADKESVVMALRVPTGVNLPDGIAYRHAVSDRVAVGLEWQQCSPSRCTAIAALSASEFRRMLRGREIVVGYRPLPNSKVLNVPLSLLGLTAAWREVAACQLRASQF